MQTDKLLSRGNIVNNKVNLPYGPQTITIATKKNKKLLKVKKSEPRPLDQKSGISTVHLYSS